MVLVTKSRTEAKSTVSNYLLVTEDVRIEGLQDCHIILRDIYAAVQTCPS